MRRIVWFSVVIVALALGVSLVLERERLVGVLVDRKAIRESEVRVLELNAKGVKLLNSRQVQRAIEALEEAHLIAPENDMVKRNLSLALSRHGQASADDGRADEAIASYERSLRLWEQNPEALELLSVAEYENGEYRRALQYASRLAGIYPERDDIRMFMAAIRSNIRETEGMVSERGQYFRLLYSGKRRLQFEGELITMLQTQMDRLTVALGVFPDEPVEVLILTGDLGERAQRIDPMVEGLYDGKIRLYFDSINSEDQALVSTVRHEIVHALLHRAAGGVLPAWFQEGVAQKVGEDPGTEDLKAVHRRVKQSVLEGRNLDLASLGDSFLMLPGRERTEAYAASLLFADYLIRRYGARIIPVILMDLRTGVGFEEALADLTGRAFKELEADFIADLTGEG